MFFKNSFCFKRIRLEPDVVHLSFFWFVLFTYTILGKWRIKRDKQ